MLKFKKSSVPGEEHRYSILGFSYSYQFSNKNYLTAQMIGNVFNKAPMLLFLVDCSCSISIGFE